MKEIKFLIYDVRNQTDNNDENGVKDREFVRYFNDGVKTIQAIIFKNNPLCSYYQEPKTYSPVAGTREYTLPSDCYGDNAVSLVEIKSGTRWYPIDRVWPEDKNNFFGWYTRNKTVVIAGREDVEISEQIRIWYFKRLPRFDKSWATVTSVAGQVITIGNVDTELFKVDRYITIIKADGTIRYAGYPFTRLTDATITVVGSLVGVVNTDVIIMGKNSLMTLDLPEEVEPYLMDYVAQRVVGRNNYTEDWNKMNYWTSEERSQIISIFADASQAQTRAPITDTDYLEI